MRRNTLIRFSYTCIRIMQWGGSSEYTIYQNTFHIPFMFDYTFLLTQLFLPLPKLELVPFYKSSLSNLGLTIIFLSCLLVISQDSVFPCTPHELVTRVQFLKRLCWIPSLTLPSYIIPFFNINTKAIILWINILALIMGASTMYADHYPPK